LHPGAGRGVQERIDRMSHTRAGQAFAGKLATDPQTQAAARLKQLATAIEANGPTFAAAREAERHAWKARYGRPFPKDIDELVSLFVEAGGNAETALQGKFTFADVIPIIEGYLSRQPKTARHRRNPKDPARPTDRQKEIADAVVAHLGNRTNAGKSLGISRQEVSSQLAAYIAKMETHDPDIAKQFKESIRKPKRTKTQRHAHDRNGQPFIQQTDRRRMAKPIRHDEKD